MARRVKTTKTAKPVVKGRKTRHPAASAKRPAKKAGRSAKGASSPASPKRTPGPAPSAPKLSKDELRAQVEKLERANANLRMKSREAGREAKTTAARIVELEAQVARLEKRLAAQAAAKPVKDQAAPAPKSRRTRPHKIEASASAPPEVAGEEDVAVEEDVAAEESAMLGQQAEVAPADLEELLVVEATLEVGDASSPGNLEEQVEEEAALESEDAGDLGNMEEHPEEGAPFDLAAAAAGESPEEHLEGEVMPGQEGETTRETLGGDLGGE